MMFESTLHILSKQIAMSSSSK
uniref:Uncharacterized protein n=1 Tax=Arundo donax TaxID=35708 RepID=A0A0A9CCU4_ARUDO